MLQKLGAIFILVPILTGLGYGDSPAEEWETFEVAGVQPRCEYLTKDDAAVLAGTKARRKLIEKVATHWSDLLAKKGKSVPFENFAALGEGILKVDVIIIDTAFPAKVPAIVAQAKTTSMGSALEETGDRLVNHPTLWGWFHEYWQHEKRLLDTIMDYEEKLGRSVKSSIQPFKNNRESLRQEFRRLVNKVKA